MRKNFTNIKIGILGAGQLGKMICEIASDWNLNISLLDKSLDFPAAQICSEFVSGDFNNYDDVFNFGKDKDIVSIEIEGVNVEALFALEKMGVEVHPKPESLAIIKDKGLQKDFYRDHQYPSSTYHLFNSKSEIQEAVEAGKIKFPFVWKARKGGYDGKGVSVIKSYDDLSDITDTGSLIEELVDIEKELAVIAARNKRGEVKVFPIVEMEFNPEANLVEYLFAPAAVDSTITKEANQLASKLIEDLDLCGLLAVEFFLPKSGSLLVNEVAPRPHNSGHHSIESCLTSQFQQFLRGILDLPLGDTDLIMPSVMINLLGEPDYNGPAIYEGFEECIKQSGTYVHLYGKKETRPFRKMGHATVLDHDLERAKEKAKFVKQTLKIKA